MYHADLAAIHHAGFGDFARRAAPGLLQLLRDAGVPQGTVVDWGCGSGIWLGVLARAGYQVLGIDRSPSLVRIARRVAPNASVRSGSIYRLALPRCDAITAIGEVLSYLPAPPVPTIAAKVARALRPGGVFVFDLLIRTRLPSRYRSWAAGVDWAVLVEASENRTRSTLTREITTFLRTEDGFRRRQERHRVRLAESAEVRAAFRAAGLSISTFHRYGGQPLAPGRLGFKARRRG